MSPSTSIRMSPQEHAQPRSSVNASEMPSRQQFDSAEAQSVVQALESNPKNVIPQRNYEYIVFSLQKPELKSAIVADFALASKDAVLKDNGDLLLPADSSSRVLLWKDRVVVPQNLLYDAIHYCHTQSGHGDFSRTMALVKRYYTFVPACSVHRFVDACPTCTAGRDNAITSATSDDPAQNSRKVLSLSNSFDLLAFSESRNDGLSTFPSMENMIVSPPLFSRLSNASGGSESSQNSQLQSHPMSREVSLFQGLPNGWQYYTDFEHAHQDFMRYKDEIMAQQPRVGHKRRPRIPSVAPLIPVNFNFGGNDGLGGDMQREI
ncbi:hypothetical protein F5878DRAFT_386844 [Lentinula raphanica]|uniref:Integrase zinc-binding domain-containing protein n=1 Tax=Lentinula raphanica TaxID=153919 RepID=A0AA38P0C5_9AGAR|nr:hypothetical protein C8R42DRAFT_773092 [Lentinula raphanica]KAJ3817125.1 hypothetical protein F5880DRAFT_118724 [Lentinula raphanica]KAJ3833845.1 hypothetical protein F5878DRAFT_386844 [Lentinula raphanica]